MPVCSYELDREVFQLLNQGIKGFDNWQGEASRIADYVASWGIERFWAMSRSQRLLGGELPDAGVGSDEEKRYFAWSVARVTLCKIAGSELGIEYKLSTTKFQEKFGKMSFNQQVLLTDLLMEIAEAIQFWTMRLKDANKSNTNP